MFLVGCLLYIGQSVAQKKKDTLYFNNGSTLVGELIKIEKGVMTFDPDDANNITLQLRKIKTIRAHSKIFRIETTAQNVYYSKLKPSPLAGFANMISLYDTSSILLTEISTLYAFEQSVWKKFSGSVGGGFSYTRSSDLGRFNFDGSLKYLGSKFEGILTANTIATIEDSAFSRDRENIGLTLKYYFDATWFATTFVSYQKNLELGIKSRYQEGLGMGNKFLHRKNMQAYSVMGLVLIQERSVEGSGSKTLVEVPLQLRYDLYQFTKPKIDLQFYQTFYFSLSQKGRIRNDGQLTINWELIDDLTLGLTFYNNFDNQPPSSSSRKFDYGTVFNVGYKF